MANYFYAYHGPTNDEEFDFKGGYGVDESQKYKIEQVKSGDKLFIIQNLSQKEPIFYLCGLYEIIGKYEDWDAARPFRVRLSDLTKLKSFVELDEVRLCEELPFNDADVRLNTFKNHFCQRGLSFQKPLATPIITVLSEKLNLTDEHKCSNEKVYDDWPLIEDQYLNSPLSNIEKEQVVKSRIGQSKYRKNLLKLWKKCPITKCDEEFLLRASHIKPWHKCAPGEHLDINNGLLLAIQYDVLFDSGYISFDKSGNIQISSSLSKEVRKQFNISPSIKLDLTDKHQVFMDYHRKYIFKK